MKRPTGGGSKGGGHAGRIAKQQKKEEEERNREGNNKKTKQPKRAWDRLIEKAQTGLKITVGEVIQGGVSISAGGSKWEPEKILRSPR